MRSFEFAVPSVLRRVRVLPSGASSLALDGTDYKHGFEAGYKEGEWKAKAEGEHLRRQYEKQMGALLAKLERAHQALLETAEEHLPQLLLLAMDRLFQRHYFTAAQVAEEVSRLLKELTQAEQISIECSPEELEAIRHPLDALGLTAGQGRLTWTANPSLLAGEFVLQSDLGTVDGRRISRITRLRRALEGDSHEKNA